MSSALSLTDLTTESVPSAVCVGGGAKGTEILKLIYTLGVIGG